MTTTWLHGSPHKIEAGEILRPGVKSPNYKQSPKKQVSITSEHDTAFHWGMDAAAQLEQDVFYIYEVKPVGLITPHRVGPKNFGKDTAYYEARVDTAQVVRVVEEREVFERVKEKHRKKREKSKKALAS